jgi:hypothetical protein
MRAAQIAHVPALAALVSIALLTGGCDLNTALEKVVEARSVTSELILQFTKAVEASNRAVMANTDTTARAAANDAAAAIEIVERDTGHLRTLFAELNFSDESILLDAFTKRFASYKRVHESMVNLAVEGTNLKAEQLAFGPAQTTADAFAKTLSKIAAHGVERERVDALSARAVAAVREIQALQAPHIQEPGDEAMTRLETRMSAAVGVAQKTLGDLAAVVAPGERSKISEASQQLTRFLTLHAEILVLSRKNTNVRSLALALDERRKLANECEADLRTLQAALAKRGFVGTR